MNLEDTQPMPILRDFNCPRCGMGTSRIGGECLDCVSRQTQTCRDGGCACGECAEA